MNTSAIERLLNNATVNLPGVLPAAIQLEFFNVMDEFCQKSHAWREDIYLDLEIGETEYEIYSEERGAIISLLSFNSETGTPNAATMSVPGRIILGTAPSEIYTCIAKVAVTVVPTGSEYPTFPDWLWNSYSSGLIDGVLGRMMAQMAKPYSNERMSVYHLRLFNNVIARARSEADHQNLKGGQKWRFPQSFAPCR